jgi:hypothetical protein
MGKFRVAMVSLLALANWVLTLATTTHDVRRWTPPILSTLAILIVLWAELNRHSTEEGAKKRERDLEDRVSLNTSVDPSQIRCYPSIIHAPLYDGGQLRIRLVMNREVRMEGGLRCLIEDPTGHVTCHEYLYPIIREGEEIEFAYPRDFPGAAEPGPGAYLVVWEQAVGPGFPGPMKFCTYRWMFDQAASA